MAGSLVYRTYTADDGTNYSIKIDESNAESAINGETLCAIRAADYAQLPRTLKVRYVLAYDQDTPNRRKKFTIGNRAAIDNIFTPGAIITTSPSSTGEDGVDGSSTYVITAYRGEKQNFIPSIQGTTIDTGLDDGDPN